MPDLTGLPGLDIAIGLSFIFLLLSLVASAGQELLASLFALRSKTLERGLRNMLETTSQAPAGSAAANATAEGEIRDLTSELYTHPLIRSLYRESWWPFGRIEIETEAHATGQNPERKHGRLPSYISPRSFAVAVLDTVAPSVVATNDDGTPKPSSDVISATRTEILKLNIPSGVKHRLLTLLDNARGDIDAFRLGLEAWFDDTMARVSGWYKRKAQLFVLLIAVAVTVALNANTLTIGERLWRDPALRATIIQKASAANGTTPGPDAKTRLTNAVDDVERVSKLGVPIGWSRSATDPRHVTFSGSGWARTLGGWLLTVMAVSLGAPFWFDALGRLSRLRGTGKPEAPLPPTSSGRPNERVVTATAPLNVSVQQAPTAAVAGAASAAPDPPR